MAWVLARDAGGQRDGDIRRCRTRPRFKLVRLCANDHKGGAQWRRRLPPQDPPHPCDHWAARRYLRRCGPGLPRKATKARADQPSWQAQTRGTSEGEANYDSATVPLRDPRQHSILATSEGARRGRPKAPTVRDFGDSGIAGADDFSVPSLRQHGPRRRQRRQRPCLGPIVAATRVELYRPWTS